MSRPTDEHQHQLPIDIILMQTQTQTRMPVETRTMLRGNTRSPNPPHDNGQLTASNLELHDYLVHLEQQRGFNIASMPPAATSLVEQVAKDERVHQLYSTLLLQHTGSWESQIGSDGSLATRTQSNSNSALDGNDILCDIDHRPQDQSSPSNSSGAKPNVLTLNDELSELSKRVDLPLEGHGVCFESPLERFLTPSAVDGPTYYTRPAMEQMSVQDGTLDTMQQRKGHKEMNMAVAAENKEQAGQATQSLVVEMGY